MMAQFMEQSCGSLQELRSLSMVKTFIDNSLVFSEGDQQGFFYIIESGSVAIYIDKSGKSEQVSVLTAGDYFGEMAIFTDDKRAATAMALGEVVLHCVQKEAFLDFLDRYPQVEKEITSTLVQRNEKLLLKEKLVVQMAAGETDTGFSIKGDPALRMSSFLRDRYASIVDGVLPQLEIVLEDLLLNHCVYRLFLNLNSGEVRTCSIFSPFNEEIHTVDKLLNRGYRGRHFIHVSYDSKVASLQRMFDCISTDNLVPQMDPRLQDLLPQACSGWSPVSPQEISGVVRKIATLRQVESFYLCNISLSIVQDVIRMQFNCDGTHFVSTEGYQQFIDDNL